MTRRALMVVAKQPAPGQTKTRLSPPLSGNEAAALYECFLRDTLDTIREARKVIDFQPIIAYLPSGTEPYFRELAPDFELLLQQGADLSERLNNATTYALTPGGCDQVVIMDSDSPTLPAENLCRAFTALDRPDIDVSLGPCDDGGYYLIGLKRPEPDLFLKVTMSTPHVVQDTLAQVRAKMLHVEMLPLFYDIDYVADLHRMVDELAASPSITAVHTRAFLLAYPVNRKVG
jgi:uncharacterized protein